MVCQLTKDPSLEAKVGVGVRAVHLVDEDGNRPWMQGRRASVQEDEKRPLAAEVGDQK